jgi:hypothetical protein
MFYPYTEKKHRGILYPSQTFFHALRAARLLLFLLIQRVSPPLEIGFYLHHPNTLKAYAAVTA